MVLVATIHHCDQRSPKNYVMVAGSDPVPGTDHESIIVHTLRLQVHRGSRLVVCHVKLLCTGSWAFEGDVLLHIGT